VTGKLGRAMAMGGESTGWAIQFESETAMEGKQVSSVEVEYHKIKKLERLENKVVSATGVVSHRQGVEMGDRLVLVISSMTESNPGAPPVSEDLQHKFVEQVPVSYPLFTLRGNVPSFYRDIARYPAIFLIDRQGRLQPAQPRLSMGSGRQFFGITLAC